MLDLYNRECPRCHAHLEKETVLCPSCHRLLPRRLSRRRRVVENTLAGVAVAAVALALLAPDLVRSLRGIRQPQAAAASRVPEWHGPGPEPAARAWAAPIESSLQSVCRNTLSRYEDKKFIVGSLTQYLPAATRAQGRPLTQELLKMSPEEEKDLMEIFSDDPYFMGMCLKWGYEAIRTCEPFKADLAGAQAQECMIPAVTRALAPAPFRLCASEAKIDRVRRACGLAAEVAQRLAQKPEASN